MTVIEDTVPAAYEVKGSTDDITACEHCGRRNLKKTVILAPLDADGTPTGDVIHMGVGCAATATGRKATHIRDAAAAVDHTRQVTRDWAVRSHPLFAAMTVADYIAANRGFVGRPVDAAAALASTVAEAAQILAGDITGTRFDTNRTRLARVR
jgi:hypothetical protein